MSDPISAGWARASWTGRGSLTAVGSGLLRLHDHVGLLGGQPLEDHSVGQLRERTGDDAGRPGVPAGDGGPAAVDAAALFALGAAVLVLVDVVPGQWRRELVGLAAVDGEAAVALPGLRGADPVLAVADHLAAWVVRAGRRA